MDLRLEGVTTRMHGKNLLGKPCGKGVLNKTLSKNHLFKFS